MKIRLSLPKKAKMKVIVGKPVKFGDPLFETKETSTVSINVISKLKINKKNLFQHLNYVIGDPIVKGDVIAQKKGMLSTKKVFSEYTGTISQIDHETGDITITTTQDSEESQSETFLLKAFFNGVIESIDEKLRSYTVNVSGGIEIPLRDVPEDGGGAIYFFTDESHYFTASEDELIDKTIVISELKSHIVAKCEALGCSGFVYLKKNSDTTSSGAAILDVDSYNKLISSKKKYILYSASEKKAIAYD